MYTIIIMHMQYLTVNIRLSLNDIDHYIRLMIELLIVVPTCISSYSASSVDDVGGTSGNCAIGGNGKGVATDRCILDEEYAGLVS